MSDRSKLFLEHVEREATEAERELQAVLRMIREDAHPGLAMWMLTLGAHLESAKAAIDRAQVMP